MTEWCSIEGCVKPEIHSERCPGKRDCSQCQCCTAAICAEKAWRMPGVPQHMVGHFNITCPCERRG